MDQRVLLCSGNGLPRWRPSPHVATERSPHSTRGGKRPMDELGFHRTLHRPGTLLDVGAHDGAFTLPFAALPGSRVLAFEPLPAAFARLREAAGGLPNVSLHQAALGDATGEVTLSVPVVDGVANEQWASTAKSYVGHGARVGEQRFAVPLRRLDEFDISDLTTVKLDAEGAEYEV